MVVNGQESPVNTTRQSDTDSEAEAGHLARIDTWRMLHPEVLESESAHTGTTKSLSPQSGMTSASPSDAKNDDPQGSNSSNPLSEKDPLSDSKRVKSSNSASSSSQDLPVHPDSSPESKDGESDNTHTESKKPLSSPYQAPASDLPEDDIDSPTISLMESPGVQVMERIDSGYNPNRIPSSVFSRSDSVNPGEWSIASNESLFSLHVGNASMGGDQSFSLSGKSWEFGKSGELKNSGDLSRLNELAELADEPSLSDHLPSTSTPGIEASKSKRGDHSSRNRSEGIGKSQEDNDMKGVKKGYMAEKDEIRPLPIINNSISRRSDASEESTCSFAFPILAPCGGPSSIHPKTDNVSPRTRLPFVEQNLHAKNSTVSTPGAPLGRKSRNHHSKWSKCYSCFPCFSCRSFCSFPFFRSCPCRRCC